MNKIYILIVNWDGWADTVECLETVFRSDYENYRVIVCDNGSQDNSFQYIKAWVERRLEIIPPRNTILQGLFRLPLSKTIEYREYDCVDTEINWSSSDDVPLVLIQTGYNRGFAGGNNVGLKYVLARADFDYVWLLNNDTVIKSDALTKLVDTMGTKPNAGMCGSTLVCYDKPYKIQAYGGAFYCKWIGLPWQIGHLKKFGDPIDVNRVEQWMNYVSGASMLVSKEFLLETGLMCEEYFLYFEEIDWMLRGKGRFSLAYASESVVYHKVGRSIGTSSNPRRKSYTCDYYNIRNRLFFTRRFFPHAMPTVYLVLLGTLLLRLFLGKWDRAAMAAKLFVTYNKPVKIS